MTGDDLKYRTALEMKVDQLQQTINRMARMQNIFAKAISIVSMGGTEIRQDDPDIPVVMEAIKTVRNWLETEERFQDRMEKMKDLFKKEDI